MNRFALLASFLLAGALLGGCPETTRCPEGQVRAGGECVDRGTVDGGGFDGAVDGQVDGGADAGPCGECGGTTPHCVVDRDGGPACRECDPSRDDEDCAGVTGRPVCDPTTQACVECYEDADCTAPDASRCDANRCVGCEAAEDCENIVVGGVELDVCDTSAGAGMGRCVECTEADEATNCGALACDQSAGRCSETVRTLNQCGTCTSDLECRLPLRCIPMNYMGAPTGRSHCLRPVSEGCDVPYSITLEDRESASGRPAADYCGINEGLTTCEAVLAYGNACGVGGDPTPCNGAGASRCGTLGALTNRCTYACTLSTQCVGNQPCDSGQCQ